MAVARTDTEQMDNFLKHLRRFDDLLENEFRSILGHWRELGGVWNDVKYQELGRDLEETARGVERYLNVSETYESHLAGLISGLEEAYFNRRL